MRNVLTVLMLAALPVLAAEPTPEGAKPPVAIIPEPAEKPFTWPTVRYDGEARSASWLDAAYERFAANIVLANGKYINLQEPPGRSPYGLISARQERRIGTIREVKELPNRFRPEQPPCYELKCDTATGTSIVAQTEEMAAKPEVGRQVLLSSSGPRWQAILIAPMPITRAQFAEALNGGLLVTWFKPCPDCDGKGCYYVKNWRRNGLIREEVSTKKSCRKCGGTGKVRIRRSGI
jgi:hypothetical protein